MFRRAMRSSAKVGTVALLGAPILLLNQHARAEQRVYVSGYAPEDNEGFFLICLLTYAVVSEALGRGVRLELWKAQVSGLSKFYVYR